MAKMTIGKGLDEYLSKIGNLEHMSPKIIGFATYEGAKVVADQIRANIQALPTSTSGGGGRRNPTQVEKAGLLEGLGVAKHQVDGSFYNVKIGMDGYNAHVTERYPQGHPNAMVARSIEAGTSFMNRIPFISRAVSQTRAAAEDAMREEVDKQIKETMGEG